MKKVEIKNLFYSNALGKVLLKNIPVTLEEDDYRRFKDGTSIDELDYGLGADVIVRGEKEIAKDFYKRMYRAVLNDKQVVLSIGEIQAIQTFLRLNNAEFAQLIGINKASLTNIYKRGKLSKPVELLIVERLGMELSRPGSAKSMAKPSESLPTEDLAVTEEISDVRFKPGSVA